MSEPVFHRALVATPFGAVHCWVTGSGPSLLMLHQSAQSSDEFLGVAARLREAFQVVSLDLPGHGMSDSPTRELSVADYSEAVLIVLDALEIATMHVLGHHGGCRLAVNIAVNSPKKVAKIVLSGGGLLDPALEQRLLNEPMTRDLPVDAEGQFLHDAWAVYRQMSAPGTAPETTFLPFVTGLKARLRPYDMHYAVLRWDYPAALEKLQQPTLLIRAEHDPFSGDVAGLHRRLPDSALLELTDCGPWLFYERPDLCAAAIREFLDR